MMTLQWSNNMTDEQKRAYMLEVNREQLVDHITSGAADAYFVYDAGAGYGPFSDYAAAKAKFDALRTPGYCYIALATRLGSAVEVASKVIE